MRGSDERSGALFSYVDLEARASDPPQFGDAPGVAQVERWFRVITQQAIRRGSFSSVKELVTKIDHFVALARRLSAPRTRRAARPPP
jgi:hypothetical protein